MYRTVIITNVHVKIFLYINQKFDLDLQFYAGCLYAFLSIFEIEF